MIELTILIELTIALNSEWVEEVRVKIDAAIAIFHHTPPGDGETFIHDILKRFQQEHQA